MDVLMIAHFTGDLAGEDNIRFLYLCDLLSKTPGINVELVTTDFSHSTKMPKKTKLQLFHYKITLLHEPGYPTNICPQRFYSHYVFGKNVKKYLSRRRKKPDVVYCAVPSLSCANATADYCKENHIRFIIDVQDLWPEAFQMVFHVPVVSDLFFAPFRYLADKAYAAADEIVAVSKTYAKRALRVNKKCKKPTVVYLGTDKSEFDSYADLMPDEYLNDSKALRLAYVGSLTSNYDIPDVFKAIAKIKDMVPVKLLIMGDGPFKIEFENTAEGYGIDCKFTGRLTYPQMVINLKYCDIAINPIIKGSAGSIINRVGDYAMAGLPVINTQESKEYRSLIDHYNAGINCECENADDIADAIVRLYKDEDLRRQMAENSRKVGMEYFNRASAYQRVVSELSEDSGEMKVLRIAYCGTLGSSYDITVVIDAIRELVKNNHELEKSIRFIAMGDGPRKEEFENKAKGLPIFFTGRLPYEEMVWVLNKCDVAVNPIEHGAAQSIINKHMDYAMAGLPVINTQEGKEYRSLIKHYKMGFNCQNGDVTAVKEKILQLMEDKDLRLNMGRASRRCGEELFDRDLGYRKLVKLIMESKCSEQGH